MALRKAVPRAAPVTKENLSSPAGNIILWEDCRSTAASSSSSFSRSGDQRQPSAQRTGGGTSKRDARSLSPTSYSQQSDGSRFDYRSGKSRNEAMDLKLDDLPEGPGSSYHMSPFSTYSRDGQGTPTPSSAATRSSTGFDQGNDGIDTWNDDAAPGWYPSGEQVGLRRFTRPQASLHKNALQEIYAGKKQSCWMWFCFPTPPYIVNGKEMGSARNRMYSIRSDEEARQYLAYEEEGVNLRSNYIQLVTATRDMLRQNVKAKSIFGFIDEPKLRSSLRYFETVTRNGVDPDLNAILLETMRLLKEKPTGMDPTSSPSDAPRRPGSSIPTQRPMPFNPIQAEGRSREFSDTSPMSSTWNSRLELDSQVKTPTTINSPTQSTSSPYSPPTVLKGSASTPQLGPRASSEQPHRDSRSQSPVKRAPSGQRSSAHQRTSDHHTPTLPYSPQTMSSFRGSTSQVNPNVRVSNAEESMANHHDAHVWRTPSGAVQHDAKSGAPSAWGLRDSQVGSEVWGTSGSGHHLLGQHDERKQQRGPPKKRQPTVAQAPKLRSDTRGDEWRNHHKEIRKNHAEHAKDNLTRQIELRSQSSLPQQDRDKAKKQVTKAAAPKFASDKRAEDHDHALNEIRKQHEGHMKEKDLIQLRKEIKHQTTLDPRTFDYNHSHVTSAEAPVFTVDTRAEESNKHRNELRKYHDAHHQDLQGLRNHLHNQSSLPPEEFGVSNDLTGKQFESRDSLWSIHVPHGSQRMSMSFSMGAPTNTAARGSTRASTMLRGSSVPPMVG